MRRVNDRICILATRAVAHVFDVDALGRQAGGDGRQHVGDIAVDDADAVAALIRNLEIREVDRIADGTLLEVLDDRERRHARAVVLARAGPAGPRSRSR